MMIQALLNALPWMLGALRGADTSTRDDFARAIYIGQWLADRSDGPLDDIFFDGLALFARANGIKASVGPPPKSKMAALLEVLGILRDHLPADKLDRVLDAAGYATLEATLEETSS